MTNQDLTTVPEQRKLERIICPICKSPSVAFVTEYHKAIGWRVFLFIVNFIFTIILIAAIADVVNVEDLENPLKEFFHNISPILTIYVILFLVSKFNISLQESQTHVQAICRDCGNLWLLN